MSTKDKLIDRFVSRPRDFTFDELVRVFHLLGFELNNKGQTSGSRVSFVKGDCRFVMHKPHPGNIVKRGVLQKAFEYLSQKNLI